MSLTALLRDLIAIPPRWERSIAHLSLDSRTTETGALFLALAGTNQDGRRFAADAVARGAVFVLSETGTGDPIGPVPLLVCPNLRSLVGIIADRFYGHPSESVRVVGVTGTNGKTTVTHLLAEALGTRAPCGVMGTVGNGLPHALTPSSRTTPDAVTVHRWLARFRQEKVKSVAMEVSSHALDQGRVTAVHFEGAVFTNLTREHLDYHHHMEAYGAAKAKLFSVPGLRFAVLNADDPFSQTLASGVAEGAEVWSYGTHGTVRIMAIEALSAGLRVRLATPQGEVSLESSLLGDFNGRNLAAAVTTMMALGWSAKEAASAVAPVPPVPGRMERFILGPSRPRVVVDYAHTPDALEQALKGVRHHAAVQVWCVFGCGGDRDKGKRPLMGACASQLADHVVITHDNPRHEDPDQIVADILKGMNSEGAQITVISDRRDAIAYAVEHAGAEDIVLVAGKGHEHYQQFGDLCVPYSDRQTVQHMAGAA